MKKQLFISSVVFATIYFGSALMAQTGALDNRATNKADMLDVQIWAVPAEQKVRPEDRLESNNLVWSGKDKKITLAGAGNEHVPFQLVVTTNIHGDPREVKSPDGFWIECSDFTSTTGGTISKTNIKFFIQHYIFLDAPSSPAGATGYWPDALAPMQVPFGMNAMYEIIQNRPVWVDLIIPKNTKAGKYTGSITVTQHGKKVETMALELDVFNFSLPDETPMLFALNVPRFQIANFYRKPAESEEIEKLTKVYYDKLFENRMEPWYNDLLHPHVEVKEGKVEVKFDHEKYLYYMNTLKTKNVLLDACPGNLRRQIKAEPFTPEFNAIVKSYLSQVEDYFIKNGWHDRMEINGPIDEPRSLKEYEDTRKWASLIREATKNVPILVTRTPVPPKENPEWGVFQGYANNFSIHGNHLNDPEVKSAIKEEHAKGGFLTWYCSCDQRYPQPNYFIDAPAMDMVMIPWITLRYNLDGILYWAINWWSDTVNPWINANTFLSGYLCSNGWVLNGEGSLWYPGNFINQYTDQPNIEGPVSSIRFELLREGIEDYMYISLLEKLGDKAFAEKTVERMVVDVKAFSRNVPVLYNTRKEMAARIEQLLKAPAKKK